jgi:hypothetical protein
VVEYSYWRETGGADSESISVKSRYNILRYNVFDRNHGGMLVFRNGDRNVAYGNFFVHGSSGIRVKEANDIFCYNNYFDACPQALSVNYLGELFLNNVTFAHNTFVNTSFDLTSLVMSLSTTKDKNKSKKIRFFNNLFSQFRFNVTQRKDFLNRVFEFEGNAFDVLEAGTELKKFKNLFVHLIINFNCFEGIYF